MTSRDYLFVVDGELPDAVAHAFEGMRLHRDGGTTTIQGVCRDQAEVMGTLMRISDLGLTLLGCVATGSGDAPAHEPTPATPLSSTPPSNVRLSPSHSALRSSRETSHGRQP